MINFNGDLCQNELANNRALLYADGVFETLKIIEGQILFFEDHYFRLMSAMRIMRMEIPMNFTQEFIKSEILKILEYPQMSGIVRLTAYRKAGGKYLPETNKIDYIIKINPTNNSNYQFIEQSKIVDLYNDFYVSSQLLSTIKTTSKNINVLASIYAQENDIDNCIILNEKKEVVEFINGNLFLVFDKTIATPPITSGCINGIIRKQLLKLISKHLDYKIEERTISPFELQQADELFLTNIAVGVEYISKYRKKSYDNSVSKSIFELLNNHLIY